MTHYDVAVIGGGIAGVSIAYELARRANVVLLEKEDQLAVHTTGRSAAAYLTTYGNATVRAITRASRPDFDRLERELGTPPLLTPRGLLWLTGEDTPQARAALDASGGEPIDLDEAVRRCPVLRRERIVAATAADAMDIDVLALHAGYARGLVARGGTVLREAPVGRILRRDTLWRLEVGSRTIEAETVVNAAGAWSDQVAGAAGAAELGMRPLRRTIFTSPVAGHDTRPWPLVMDAQERFYFKPEGEGVLVSPADETPVAPGDDRYEDLEVARAMDVVNEVTTLGLRRITSAWSGLRTFAPDRSPVVGAPASAPGFVWFAGQGGYGIQLAPALARIGAAIVTGAPLPDDVRDEGVTAQALSPDRFVTD